MMGATVRTRVQEEAAAASNITTAELKPLHHQLRSVLARQNKHQAENIPVKRSCALTGRSEGSSVVPERSYGGETFSGLREVTEQRKLCGVIKVLKVSAGKKQRIQTVKNGLLKQEFHI